MYTLISGQKMQSKGQSGYNPQPQRSQEISGVHGPPCEAELDEMSRVNWGHAGREEWMGDGSMRNQDGMVELGGGKVIGQRKRNFDRGVNCNQGETWCQGNLISFLMKILHHAPQFCSTLIPPYPSPYLQWLPK